MPTDRQSLQQIDRAPAPPSRMLPVLIQLMLYGKGGPHYLSSDQVSLFEYHRWKENLRILDVEEIKPVPYAQLSNPFMEPLIGTIRGELLKHGLFWNAADLKRKLAHF